MPDPGAKTTALLSGAPVVTTGELPLSTALTEASPNSLAELFSRDPEHYTKQDLDAIIAGLRADRARRAQVEAATASSPKAKPKAVSASSIVGSGVSAEDEGI